MPPKRLRSSPEVPLILPAKIQQIFEICKFRGAKNEVLLVVARKYKCIKLFSVLKSTRQKKSCSFPCVYHFFFVLLCPILDNTAL